MPHPRPIPPRQEKPFADFPLFWHGRGYWCKKRNGQQVNYGADWREALARFQRDEDALNAGKPVVRVLNHTLREAFNEYLGRQEDRRKALKIADRHFARCRTALERAGAVAGLNLRLAVLAGDGADVYFRRIRAEAMKHGIAQAAAAIGAVRACLDHAARKRLMPPPAYGESFDKPTAMDIRKDRAAREAENGARAFTLDEVRALIADSKRQGPALHAYVMLGINAAFGGGDLAELPITAVDLVDAVVRFPRPKTAMPRVCPLWTETVDALKAYRRPAPKDDADGRLFFLTSNGLPVSRVNVSVDDQDRPTAFSRTDSVQLAFRRAMARCGIARKGLGFYGLRSAFRVLAMGSGADPGAVAVVMGHGHANPMDAYYVRGDLLAKLRQVVLHVRSQVLD